MDLVRVRLKVWIRQPGVRVWKKYRDMKEEIKKTTENHQKMKWNDVFG